MSVHQRATADRFQHGLRVGVDEIIRLNLLRAVPQGLGLVDEEADEVAIPGVLTFRDGPLLEGRN